MDGAAFPSSRRRAALLGVFLAVALVGVLALGSVARAQVPDRSGEVTPEAPFLWEGDVASGANETLDPTACGKELATYCDITLVNVVPGDLYETSGGGVEFSSSGAAPGSDIDLLVFRSDASGTLGDFVGGSAGFTANERVWIEGAEGYYLVVAVYFAVTNSGYDGRAEFYRRKLTPSDVDDPPGLQDHLASDPELGYRSHSEPHIAQSPASPRTLVAASKEYNRDRDSLPEYDFKVGTQVSFDRGSSWTDLGQLNVCRREEAPPETYPLGNTCYPEDDPNLGGNEPEDETDDRGQGDWGEDYLTSDPWVDFDEEGNAYAMVLDSPSGITGGNGWGMSFHRWESPSQGDIESGETWSNRIPINAYDTPEEQQNFLDDKNTFAVNNAPGGGTIGSIVACWSKNYRGPLTLDSPPAQQVVCERSTDGGRSWPDEPTPVSPPEQELVIGVHVVADTQDPDTFYAVWLEYLSGLLDGSGTNTFYLSKSTDGGQSWSEATPVQTIVPLPRRFPRQQFRNLSLPIMAVGPNSELYLTYADYNPAPLPGDEDGMQADIKLTMSHDGGTTWSGPRKVNQDSNNADQFQQYVRATPSGQLNVSFFDRRLDVPEPPAHPGNFFIDTWLARSSDEGASWSETRLSHDSWDPSINPPNSETGEFIGDYQGLVADDCFAIPYVNDTHLANDPARDPDFDDGYPRSPFQELFSWRVPNTPLYGGADRNCDENAAAAPSAGGEVRARGPLAARSARRAQRSQEVLETVSAWRAKRAAARGRIITEAPGKIGR